MDDDRIGEQDFADCFEAGRPSEYLAISSGNHGCAVAIALDAVGKLLQAERLMLIRIAALRAEGGELVHLGHGLLKITDASRRANQTLCASHAWNRRRWVIRSP